MQQTIFLPAVVLLGLLGHSSLSTPHATPLTPLSGSTLAEPQVQQTVIEVDDMHCAACAKRIAGKLYAVPGVAGVRAVYKTSTAYVTPQQNKQPSPRALWEAVEAAEFKPVKLAGPSGTFTAKPAR